MARTKTASTSKPPPQNPFRPGNGQRPVYLAGRTHEQEQFVHMLDQTPVKQNVIVTGLRGVGKTVLLDELKPLAQGKNWLWTQNDLSESHTLTEERIARRIVVDLTTLLAPIVVHRQTELAIGFGRKEEQKERNLEFRDLWNIFEKTPGHNDDKLKAVLAYVMRLIEGTSLRGVVFAYDEAQNLSDHAAANEFPLSLILDVFSHFQRTQANHYFFLVLSGLPTLFPRLNEARTYTERMFHVLHLNRLNDKDAREAIEKPIEITKSQLRFSENTVQNVIRLSGGYPYFLQFACKEVFDAWIGKIKVGLAPSVPNQEIMEKLDQDFFAPRWQRATDRQQDFMKVIATLETSDDEFSVLEIVNASKRLLRKGFTPSHAAQMLLALAERGLVYRTRRGGYAFAVPLLGQFINRQIWNPSTLQGQVS